MFFGYIRLSIFETNSICIFGKLIGNKDQAVIYLYFVWLVYNLLMFRLFLSKNDFDYKLQF